MHVDRKNVKMVQSKKTQEVYEAKVINDSPRVIFVSVDENDPRWQRYYQRQAARKEDQSFRESVEGIGANISSKNKTLLAVIASVSIVAATLLFSFVAAAPANALIL